nr:MAG TPA: hypothetical protein [Caudoviricetes sp.]
MTYIFIFSMSIAPLLFFSKNLPKVTWLHVFLKNIKIKTQEC